MLSSMTIHDHVPVEWNRVPNLIVVDVIDSAESPTIRRASGFQVICRAGARLPLLFLVLANLALSVQRRVATEQLVHCPNPRQAKNPTGFMVG